MIKNKPKAENSDDNLLLVIIILLIITGGVIFFIIYRHEIFDKMGLNDTTQSVANEACRAKTELFKQLGMDAGCEKGPQCPLERIPVGNPPKCKVPGMGAYPVGEGPDQTHCCRWLDKKDIPTGSDSTLDKLKGGIEGDGPRRLAETAG